MNDEVNAKMDDKASPNKMQAAPLDDDSIDLTAWIRAAWRTRRLVLTLMMITAIGLGGLLAFMRLGLPSTQTFQHAIQFVFQNSEKGEYPNGNKFAVSDLISPSVLNTVYDDNKLQDFGISQRDFASFVTVRAYSPVYGQLVTRYRAQLDNRKLTFAERKAIEQEMQAELTNLQSRNAIIGLTVKKRIGIPKALGQKLLNDIAAAWATLSINQLGVLDLPQALEQKNLIDMALLRKVDYPVAAMLLRQGSVELMDTLKQLESFKTATSVVDPKSGYTIASLRRSVIDTVNYSLEDIFSSNLDSRIAKSPARLAAYIDGRIARIESRIKNLQQAADSIRAAILEFSDNPRREALASSGSGDTNGKVTADPLQRTSTTIGDRFLDRLITFIRKGLDTQGRIETRRRRTRLRNQILEFMDKQRAFKTQLVDWKILQRKFNSGANTSAGGASSRAGIEKELLGIAQALNNDWKALGRLYAQVSPRALSYRGYLYVPINLRQSERYATTHPIMNARVGTAYFAGIIASGLLALLIGLIWQSIGTQSRNDAHVN